MKSESSRANLFTELFFKMRKDLLIATLSIFLCFFSASTLNPGIKFTITPAAVKNFNDNILPLIVDRLQAMNIPDVNEKGIHVQRISIHKLSVPSNAVISNFGNNNLVLGTSRFGIEIRAHIEKKILFVKVKTDVVASCGDSSVVTDISFGFANGHPQIGVRDFKVNINKLHVKMSGGIISKIVQLITNVFHGPIQKLASKIISSQVRNKLGEGINKALTRIPNTIPLPMTPISVAYNLVTGPVVTPGYLSLPVEGTFFLTSQGKNVPPVAPATPMPDYDPGMGGQIQLFLNQYLFNSGLYAAWLGGLLKVEISHSLVDLSAGFQLNVGWLKQYAPGIAGQYADDNKLVLAIESKNNPTVALTTNNFGVAFLLGVKVFVLAGGQRIDVLDTECNIDLQMRIDVQNWVFKPAITGGQVRGVKVIRSNVGQVDENKLKVGYNQVTQATARKIDVGKAAFNLPASPDATMATVSLAVKEGYIQIAATPTFRLPPE